jgi:hypothetical protein
VELIIYGELNYLERERERERDRERERKEEKEKIKRRSSLIFVYLDTCAAKKKQVE